MLDIICQCLFSSSNSSKHCQTFHFAPPCLPRHFVKILFKHCASTLLTNVQIYAQTWQDDERRSVMWKQIGKRPLSGVKRGVSHPQGEPCVFLNHISHTCKQLCQALLPQRLIFWEPPKRHLIFKWADRWKRVTGVGRWRVWWLMVQWHVVAGKFMSQSKSEY